MLATAGTPDAIGTGDVSGRQLLSAAAGAKSREQHGQERPRAALKREHGSDEPFRANARRKANGRRGQRAGMLSRSWLRFVLTTPLSIATRPARVNASAVLPARLRGRISSHRRDRGGDRSRLRALP